MKTFEKNATLVFDDDLRELLPRSRRNNRVINSFNGPQSAKHLIESLGIPHTEVGGIRLGGVEVGWGYLVKDGDTIHVSSAAHGDSIDSSVAFVADGHLGRLAASLRMLGLDCAYRGDFEDSVLLEISLTQGRYLLTRDRRLLMHRELTRGYLVRALEPPAQLAEMVERFNLNARLRPLTRCIRCNQLLRTVEKQAILHRLEPLTRLYFDEFRECPDCGQVYWRGSHVEKILDKIRRNSAGNMPRDLDGMVR